MIDAFGNAVRCKWCPLLPDRYWICMRDCLKESQAKHAAANARKPAPPPGEPRP